MRVKDLKVHRWRSSGSTVLLLLGLAVATLACSADPGVEMATESAEPSATAVEPDVDSTTIVEELREPSTIMLAIDTSLSMLAEDTPPNSRFVAAKEALNAFLDEVSAETNVGLVSFSGIATVLVEPTSDHVVLRSAIRDLELDEATAIGEAIFASIDSLESFIVDVEGDAPPAQIVLLSDGETTVGRPDAAAVQRAQQAGIRVSTIAFGTDSGTIDDPERGLPIPVPVNSSALAEIAGETGGRFFEATTTAELIEILTAIGSTS